MAELWKNRARKPTGHGIAEGWAARGFSFATDRAYNRNDLVAMIRVGDYRLAMTQAEWEKVVQQVTWAIKELEK